MAADYSFIRDLQDKDICAVLVGRLYPAKALFAVVGDQKGADDYVITPLAQLISNTGYGHIVYKSDQEASIRAMFEDAFRRSHHQGSCYNPKLR